MEQFKHHIDSYVTCHVDAEGTPDRQAKFNYHFSVDLSALDWKLWLILILVGANLIF